MHQALSSLSSYSCCKRQSDYNSVITYWKLRLLAINTGMHVAYFNVQRRYSPTIIRKLDS